ncbi:AAA family ATPase [Anaerorhabdus sp.]|uniref:AAA family ATPase n=1 Tax=Anaerorhabdus sp. TaxID=1872524 RepID=UPI002FC902FF
MYCFLVSGIPASGKTKIAQILSNEFSIPVISKDSIKEIMFDDIGFNNRNEKVNLGIASMNIMYYLSKQLMKSNQSFVLENNFEQVSIKGLETILNEYHYETIHIHVTGDPRIIYQRFVNRDKSEERHLGHVVNTKYPVDELPNIIHAPTYEEYLLSIESRGMKEFEFGKINIELDNTYFDEEKINIVIQKIKRIIR